MTAYLKKFWITLAGGLLIGVALAILLDIPIRFTVSLAIFVFLLNTIIEQSRTFGAVTDTIKKIATFIVGVIIFVGLRAIVGYLLDLPAGRSYEDLVSGNGVRSIPTQSLTTNLVFELLFLVPGIAIAYLVVKEGRKWRVIMVMVSTLILIWVGWTMKQKTHAEAMKRLTAASIKLNTRGLNDKAVAKEAAAVSSSFGLANDDVAVFYSYDGTNMVWNQAITNVVRQGQRVLRLRSTNAPTVFKGQAFTEVVLQNTNGSYVGGTEAWVEDWKFSWDNGRNTVVNQTPKAGIQAKITLKKGDALTYRLALNEATPWIEVPKGVVCNISKKNFRVFYANGHPPIDVGEKDVMLPDVAPTILKIGSLVPDNEIIITGM